MCSVLDLPAELIAEILQFVNIQDIMNLSTIPYFRGIIEKSFTLVTYSNPTYFKKLLYLPRISLTDIKTGSAPSTMTYLIETDTIYELIHHPDLSKLLRKNRCYLAIGDYTKIKFLMHSTRDWVSQISSDFPKVTLIFKEGLQNQNISKEGK